MKTNKRRLMAFVVATVPAVTAFAAAAQQGGYGPGPGGGYGPGMMDGYGGGYGPGMMGPGGYWRGYMGPWMMGPGWGGPGWGTQQTDLALSSGDVKAFFERWLAWGGNPRLTVGDVQEKDADTITVDIVTKDKSGLVQRYAVNRHTGFFRPDEG